MKTLTTFCLVDSELKDTAGHYANFAHAMVGAANQAGLQVEVLGNQGVTADLKQRLSVKPVFHSMTHRFLSRRVAGYLLNPVIGNWVHYQELHSAMSRRMDDQWLVLVSTANHRYLMALGWWLRKFPPDKAPAVVIQMRFNYFDLKHNRWHPTFYLLQPGLWLLERAAQRYRVRLMADSERLANEYRRATTLPVSVLPVPHMVPEPWIQNSFQSICKADQGETRPLRLVYLGEAREEKGFDVLVDALAILDRQGRLAGMEFVIQSYHLDGKQEWVRWVQQKLERLASSRIKIITAPVDQETYYRMMAEADVVLIPYRRYTYATRSSGVFADSLALGKPVIATADTWTGDQIAEYEVGLTIRDGDSQELAKAILEMCRRFSFFAEKAKTAQRRWLETHNADNFLAHIMDLVS